MPVLSRLISVILRIGELAFAAVVAGLIGNYLDNSPSTHPTRVYARFIYTIIVAGVSMLLALLWLIPFSSGFFSWPIDFLLSLAWFAAFALLVNYNKANKCGGRTFNWNGLTGGGPCNRFRTAQVFSFLSAVFWLVSAIVGLWFIQSERKKKHNTQGTSTATGAAAAPARPEEAGNTAPPVKRPWYTRYRV